MVLKASTSGKFLHSSSGSEESKQCLVGEHNLPQAKNVKEIGTPSVLIRILISFGFMKGIMKNPCQERVISGDMDDEKRENLETCDQHNDCESMQKESLITKEGKTQWKPNQVSRKIFCICA